EGGTATIGLGKIAAGGNGTDGKRRPAAIGESNRLRRTGRAYRLTCKCQSIRADCRERSAIVEQSEDMQSISRGDIDFAVSDHCAGEILRCVESVAGAVLVAAV